MTAISEELSDEKLSEMLAGLEGVTPGPWHEGDHWVFVPPATGEPTHALENVLSQDKPQANAAHIARCDPDTIRALILELQSLRSGNGGEVREALTSLLAWTKFELAPEAITKQPWAGVIARCEAALDIKP